MISTLIVEDELDAADRIRHLVESLFQDELKIVGIATDFRTASRVLAEEAPILVFLDVELASENAFDWLRSLGSIDFHIIFTTAHSQYAIDAFRWSALDYLLKPIVTDDFETAVTKFLKAYSGEKYIAQMENLIHNISVKNTNQKRICIGTTGGLLFFQPNEILRFESFGNYTYVHLKNKQKHLVSKTLKEFDETLKDASFFRIHQSHLVNLDFVKFYERGKGGYVELEDGSQIEVSTRKKEGFLEKMLKGW